jgi:hypothetical protein
MNLKFLSVAFTNAFINVHNIDKPVCKDCKYFKYDSIYNEYQYAHCTKFSYKNLISGKIYNHDITKAREIYCGTNGTYYEPHKI